ncbi:MAG: hypothetical protein GF334_06105 [Candidatus Altiarchaeales archaeon]|nr:hypothetical protein [Candidatus Altiarchaeales archaeon]
MSDPKIIQKPSPFCHTRPSRYPLDMIIIHHIGSKANKLYKVSGAIAWFTNEELHRNKKTGKIENKVSAHYVIPRVPYLSADIVQCVQDTDVAYHAGVSQWTVDGTLRKGINNYSIGIELEGDGNIIEYTDYQYEQLTWLVRDLMSRHGVIDENILGHEDIAPSRKVDPGILFDWKRLRKEVNPPTLFTMPEVVVKGESPQVDDKEFSMESGDTPSSFFSLFLDLISKLFGKS